MTNTFQRIGNNLEKRKEEKRKAEDKYWKLSPVERIDYNMHVDKINKKYNWIWFLTITWFKAMIYLAIFLGLFGFIFNKFDEMINLIKLVWILMFQLIWLPILIDVIILFSDGIFEERDKKQLNKRFKLC